MAGCAGYAPHGRRRRRPGHMLPPLWTL